MKIAILCTAILALMQVALGLGISTLRWKYAISVGTPSDANHPLCKLRTAFSNCSEWHPLLIILMLVLQISGAPSWATWLAPAVVAARCFLIVGLTTYPPHRSNLFRILGASCTYLLTIAYAILILKTYLPGLPQTV